METRQDALHHNKDKSGKEADSGIDHVTSRFTDNSEDAVRQPLRSSGQVGYFPQTIC